MAHIYLLPTQSTAVADTYSVKPAMGRLCMLAQLNTSSAQPEQTDHDSRRDRNNGCSERGLKA